MSTQVDRVSAKPVVTVRGAGSALGGGDEGPVLGGAGVVRLAEDVLDGKVAADVLVEAVTAGSLGSLNVRRTAIRVLSVIRPALADWSMVVLPDPSPECLLVVGGDDVGFYDVISARAVEELAVGRVLRTGQSEVAHVALGRDAEASIAAVIPHPRLVAEATTMRPADVLSVPLTARGATLGVLVLVRGRDRGFGDADVELAQRVAVRAATGLSSALLYEQRAVMSAALQRSLRPPQLPAITEFLSAARFRAADEHLEIGGDFYDLDVGDDDWLLSIGDVCGKGIDAALVTGRTRQSLRTAAHFDRSPQRVLSAVNAVAYRAKTASGMSVSDLFVTVACARLRTAPSGGLSVDLAVAGHHPPVIVRADGTVEQPDVRGIAIGLRPQVTYDAVSVTLAPGDGMVLFTDGIDEAHGHHGHYGLARLQAVVSEHAGLRAEVICEAVDQDVMDYLDGRPHDDMAVVAVTCPR